MRFLDALVTNLMEHPHRQMFGFPVAANHDAGSNLLRSQVHMYPRVQRSPLGLELVLDDKLYRDTPFVLN